MVSIKGGREYLLSYITLFTVRRLREVVLVKNSSTSKMIEANRNCGFKGTIQ